VQDFDEAIAEFKAGAKLSPAPVFLYALGQSFRLDGRYEEAIRSYELFLDRAQPGDALRAVVQCHVAKMRDELSRAAMRTPPTDQPADVVPPRTSSDSPHWYEDPIGWSSVGGGVVAGAIGGFLLFDAASLKQDSANEDREPVRLELRDRAATRRTWGLVATGVGVAAVVAGIVKLSITPDAPRERRGDLSIVPGPGDVALGLVARF
jgi:tetratricopeptide (TPR) repeat protein